MAGVTPDLWLAIQLQIATDPWLPSTPIILLGDRGHRGGKNNWWPRV